MKVKAKKGLNFWCQGKRVTSETEIPVQLNHDIQCKLNDGSLIEVRSVVKPLTKSTVKKDNSK